MNETSSNAPPSASEREELAFEAIREALRALRFGTVTAVIQDGVVVQVERTEKVRIARNRISTD